jgi:rare lipoprotein A
MISLLTPMLVVSGCAHEPIQEPPVRDASAALGDAHGEYQAGWASYYASRFAGRKTANGERYDPSAMTAAHRTLPFGTVVKVERADGRNVVVRINDRGPYVSGRIIDLSRRAAQQLGMLKQGTVWVRIEVLAVTDPAAIAFSPRTAP